MKLVLCLAALVSVALAVTQQEHNGLSPGPLPPVPTAADTQPPANIKRQNVQRAPPVNVAAMTNANGDVIEFDSKNVYLAMKAEGF